MILITMAINNQPDKLQAREEQIVREQSKQEQVSTHNSLFKAPDHKDDFSRLDYFTFTGNKICPHFVH